MALNPKEGEPTSLNLYGLWTVYRCHPVRGRLHGWGQALVLMVTILLAGQGYTNGCDQHTTEGRDGMQDEHMLRQRRPEGLAQEA